MAKDSLLLDVSPSIKEVLGIQAANGVDYFTLLGVGRDVEEDGPIDQGVMERSRELRKWQNSPQYGAEVVKLLSALHRAGKILKDPPRRQAYRQQIERNERGDTASATEEFTALVRAAMADGQIDATSRRELTRFASEHGVGSADAQKIVAQVREEMKASRAAEAARPKEDDWEFRIAEQGEEGFALMLQGMEFSGAAADQSPAQLMAQAAKYGITPERAAQFLADFQRTRFKKMIRLVAGGGVVSDAQARLLLAKSPAYGLDQRQAYDLMADYTLSAQSTEEALKSLALAETFNNEDIVQIVDNSSTRGRKAGFSLGQLMPDWLRNLILIGVGVVALVLAVIWVQSNFSSGSKGIIATDDKAAPNDSGSAVAGNTAPTGEAPTVPNPTPSGKLTAQPDPPSGVLAFNPEKPGDPPAFQMSISEVTCAQYQEFLRATLDAPPSGWLGGQYPADAAEKPVTNIPAAKALAYCAWLAKQRGWAPQSVTLPSHAEFMRALRGRTTRGDPQSPTFWRRSRLGQGTGPLAVKQAQFDKIFIPNAAQMYDLIGNAAEWGREEKNGQRAVLGGDFTQTSPDFNPLAVRWFAADATSPEIGFRFVHLMPQ